MELDRGEEAALAGEEGEAVQAAYRVLLAAGEASGAARLEPVSWAHVSGVNYNTIGDAGEEFLAWVAARARARVRMTVNPMGYDAGSAGRYALPGGFAEKQESIRRSYEAMGAEPSFTCIPYEALRMPGRGARVAFAESNAAIYANSIAGLRTNKESALSALASALTGKAPAAAPEPEGPRTEVRMRVEAPDELDYGMLGFFAGKVAGRSVAISGAGRPGMRGCKALCGGLGTAGTCSRFELGEAGPGAERVDFGPEEARGVRDELDTAEGGDAIVLGSPQLGAGELSSLASMLGGRRFSKRCLVFCARAERERAARAGDVGRLERAGCEVLADCCACLTPLIGRGDADSVITNSIKGAYYLGRSNGLGVSLRPLSRIVEEESR